MSPRPSPTQPPNSDTEDTCNTLESCFYICHLANHEHPVNYTVISCVMPSVGKTVVITGGNTGIGKETARILAWRKARVIIGCRDITKGLQAAAEIIENTGNRNVEVKKLDLSLFKSVRKFAEEINEEEDRVDVLINNAGYFGPYLSTVDGLENTIQVNYLSHFLLSRLLLDKLKSCSPSRIINVSSEQHAQVSQIDINKVLSQKKEDYGVFKVYNNSKLCQVLSSIEMSKRLHGTVISAERCQFSFPSILFVLLICVTRL